MRADNDEHGPLKNPTLVDVGGPHRVPATGLFISRCCQLISGIGFGCAYLALLYAQAPQYPYPERPVEALIARRQRTCLASGWCPTEAPNSNSLPQE